MGPLLRSYVVALFFTVAVAGVGYGQEEPGEYIKQASERLAKTLDKAAKDGYSFPQNSFGFGGAFLTKDKETWVPIFTVQLTAGRTYKFMAAGDDDTHDLDLDIQDSSGKSLAADTDIAAEAKVEFSPSVSGRYTVRLRLYDSRGGLPCYCIAAMMSKK